MMTLLGCWMKIFGCVYIASGEKRIIKKMDILIEMIFNDLKKNQN